MTIQQSSNTNRRSLRIIEKSIELLDLNLSRQIVLTEVGSNDFIFTPIIPLLANAQHVYAWIQDSKYGKSEKIVAECKSLCKDLGVSNIEFGINERPVTHISNSNIITNSRFVRPLDKDLLQHCNKQKVVIPLMYEKWELRNNEIDIEYCEKNNIRVAGTSENHPLLRVFDHIQNLAIKMAMQAGFEIRDNFILIWSNDQFGKNAREGFLKNGAISAECTTDINILRDNAEKIDFIFLCNYKENPPLIDTGSNSGLIALRDLMKINPNISIIHLYGEINYEEATNLGCKIFPEHDGKPMIMSKTLAYVGPIPTLKLLCGGFKVAEILLKNQKNNLAQSII